MHYYWIFRMGHCARGSRGGAQSVYWYRNGSEFPPNAFKVRADGQAPQYEVLWKLINSSDPKGHPTGLTPNYLVGRYGNWWGAQWSGGQERWFDGIGPTECRYLDSLDRIALEHDIECWIAGEAARNPGAAIQKGSTFRVENVYWDGKVQPREYKFTGANGPHERAKSKVAALPEYLKKRLKISILLYAILNSERSLDEEVEHGYETGHMGLAGKALSSRQDLSSTVSIQMIGLASTRVTRADLTEALANPMAQNIPLSAAQARSILAKMGPGGNPTDINLRNILSGVK